MCMFHERSQLGRISNGSRPMGSMIFTGTSDGITDPQGSSCDAQREMFPSWDIWMPAQMLATSLAWQEGKAGVKEAIET